MLLTAQIIFWLCAIVVVSVYFGYPAILWLLSPWARQHQMGSDTPSITMVISAYNEAAVIREKIANTLSLDYPADRLEVLVISDASDDGTDQIVDSFDDPRMVLCRNEVRRGKSAGLTRFVPQARGKIIVFSDANSIYQRDALKKLVRHFADPEVGFVVGYQKYDEDESPAAASESTYWHYETWIKVQEGRLGSPVCGDGAIMALRTELFQPLRDDDIGDTILPLMIVARGYRGIFDADAVCFEKTAADFAGEFRRRARIVNRAFGAVLRVPQTLNPFRVGLFSVQLLLHRVLRWLVPFFLLGILVSNLYLAMSGNRFYIAFLLLQLLFYAFALLGLVPGIRRWKPVYLAYYFCLANTAAAMGVLKLLAGQRIATWNPERQQITVTES